ncbi:MAG: hypothetical protein IPJ22_11250 [Bacteroidetes bacterium]|nr:hypothetical protein [Bacteroidota bacterium]
MMKLVISSWIIFAEKAGQEVADAMKDLKENNPKLSGVIFDLQKRWRLVK